jgi:hypothetical protein
MIVVKLNVVITIPLIIKKPKITLKVYIVNHVKNPLNLGVFLILIA